MAKATHELDSRNLAEWGFALFLFGAVFWISSFYAWQWYQSVTVLGLLVFLFGWIKAAVK